MRLFLDSSVLLAACGSDQGASREIFRRATASGWLLLCSPYVLDEVIVNLPNFAPLATASFAALRSELAVVDDVFTIDRVAVVGPSKDRPILFTALAAADVLLTLDRGDFGDLLGEAFYGLLILTPGDFLTRLSR